MPVMNAFFIWMVVAREPQRRCSSRMLGDDDDFECPPSEPAKPAVGGTNHLAGSCGPQQRFEDRQKKCEDAVIRNNDVVETVAERLDRGGSRHVPQRQRGP